MNIFRLKRHLLTFLFLFALSAPALAIDCARSETVVENTICSSPQLVWMDSVLNDNYRNQVMADPVAINGRMAQWRKSRDACASNGCLRRAYFHGLSDIYNASRPFDWKGEWWNSTAINGSGGRIMIQSTADWGFRLDATFWGGAFKSSFNGDVRKFYGIGFMDKIAWGGNCAILLMPRPDGKVEVSSDTRNSCRLLMPGGIAIDGLYVRANSDPRPAPTLLSLGILPDKEMDDRFRALAGAEYAEYVSTANSVLYGQDIDNFGAAVLNLSVKGMANRKSAIVMYTTEGKIWAMRVAPDKQNRLKLHYFTTEKSGQMPKTLLSWTAFFPGSEMVSAQDAGGKAG
ncbi:MULTISPECIES: hypothetical protein [Erwinia]|uniref:lysozyme inhibitor LprI family protein n=1 Tax=Erwinia TaxID=551 RepID=UPI0006908681|nr:MULTISPECIES: hypothetical protein [Erwinia]